MVLRQDLFLRKKFCGQCKDAPGNFPDTPLHEESMTSAFFFIFEIESVDTFRGVGKIRTEMLELEEELLPA